ncbi:MAG: hypothetical protein KF832_15015 [Caldilineaceae bacterium]|nr:hypothetical protein [Caldilineaceae bacterium]
MSTLSLQPETIHGRQAYTLTNGKLRISALQGGGHLVDLRLVTADPRLAISPFYVPHYPTIDPHTYDPAQHGDRYGRNASARLSAGYMGHLLCFPAFGPPSPDEIQQDFTFHGEAVTVAWQPYQPPTLTDEAVTLYYGADLPQTRYRVERAVTVHAGETVVQVEEWIENLAPFDRPFNRDQHPTFGAPFVAPGKTMLDLPGTQGVLMAGRDAGGALPLHGTIQWPYVNTPEGATIDLRPFQSTPASTTYYPILLDQTRATSYFTLYNTDYPLLVGYLFPTADNPWIVDWQENQHGQETPSHGQMIARGIEFGTSPFDEGIRASVERSSLFGVPTYQWIGARQRLKTTYTIFLAEIPPGFPGVQDVQRQDDHIIITERGSGRQITLASRS